MSKLEYSNEQYEKQEIELWNTESYLFRVYRLPHPLPTDYKIIKIKIKI